MTVPAEYLELIYDLTVQTRAGAIKWESDPPYAFVRIADTIIKVMAGEDEEGTDFCAMTLEDVLPIGAFVTKRKESIDHWYVDRGDAGYTDMAELVRLAYRAAKDVDGRISRIRSALKPKK